MKGPREYYAEWNKSDRERQVPLYITYMRNLKNNTKECTCKIETDSQIQKETCGYQRGEGRLTEYEINRYKLLT